MWSWKWIAFPTTVMDIGQALTSESAEPMRGWHLKGGDPEPGAASAFSPLHSCLTEPSGARTQEEVGVMVLSTWSCMQT